MHTELILGEHFVINGRPTVQIMYGGRLLGVIYPEDGPGIRVISKHKMEADLQQAVTAGSLVNVMSVKVHP